MSAAAAGLLQLAGASSPADNNPGTPDVGGDGHGTVSSGEKRKRDDGNSRDDASGAGADDASAPASAAADGGEEEQEELADTFGGRDEEAAEVSEDEGEVEPSIWKGDPG